MKQDLFQFPTTWVDKESLIRESDHVSDIIYEYLTALSIVEEEGLGTSKDDILSMAKDLEAYIGNLQSTYFARLGKVIRSERNRIEESYKELLYTLIQKKHQFTPSPIQAIQEAVNNKKILWTDTDGKYQPDEQATLSQVEESFTYEVDLEALENFHKEWLKASQLMKGIFARFQGTKITPMVKYVPNPVSPLDPIKENLEGIIMGNLEIDNETFFNRFVTAFLKPKK